MFVNPASVGSHAFNPERDEVLPIVAPVVVPCKFVSEVLDPVVFSLDVPVCDEFVVGPLMS